MTLNDPPMGEKAAWQKQTKLMLEDAKLVASGNKADGIAALKKDIKCMDCHQMFKKI